MKWIQFHLENGIPVMVNLETVTSINQDCTCTDPETAPTVISFAGTVENMIVVKENYEKVKTIVEEQYMNGGK